MFGNNDLFVSPEGNDEWNGLREFPIPEAKEGPLASLEGAVKRLRGLKASGTLAAPVTVWIRGGRYLLRQTVELTPEDSAPVKFRAYPGEKPVFDGGVTLTGWEPVRVNGLEAWRAEIPAEALRFGQVDQFFVNGRRKTRASFPKNGYHRVASLPDGVHKQLFRGTDRFYVEAGAFDPTWYDPTGIEALIIHKWIEERMPLAHFDPEKNEFRSTRISCFELDPADTEYRWENVREALTEPGEYYFDRREGTVYYLPEKDEDPATMTATVPALGCFIRCVGRPEQGQYVEWLHFDGLTFVHGGAGRPECAGDYVFGDPLAPALRNYPIRKDWLDSWKEKGLQVAGFPQAALQLPGTIFLHGTRFCTLSGCTIAGSGWYGIAVDGGCTGVRLEHNTLADLGGGGIRIGGADARQAASQPQLLTSRTTVTDNHIHDCGATNLSAIGIVIVNAAGNLIEHNHIHDLYYSGISCGWTWGYGEAVTRENRIGWNRIHDLGKGVLSDMGGIYLLGIQPGTRVYNNLIFNVKCRYYGGWGIYTDEGSSHIVIEENICHDCSREGFHQHYGRENIVRYNVFAFPGEYGVAVSCGTSRQTGYELPGRNYTMNLTFINNIVLVDGKPFFKGGYQADVLEAREFYSDANCFWDVSGAGKVFAGEPEKRQMTWSEWQMSGHDGNSLLADPGFVDAAGRDFRLLPESPLRQRFFRSLDLSAAGVRKSGAV